MSDILEAGSNWLQEQRKKHATRSVLYRRNTESVLVSATVGRTVFEQDDGAGAIIRTEVRDYLIDTEELVLAGVQVLPERGDRIEEIQEGATFVYEVMPIGKEPHWRYSDPYRRTLRIHTKHIATQES
ncbi:MAG TPA: hypothetical protein PKD64_18960 [Pirellulaceae bacterium]|nr:hypothetical protein [Pirellulaceae bacterium]HMO94271.1 hypothetical protein [Pirellulaceae bacterium]